MDMLLLSFLNGLSFSSLLFVMAAGLSVNFGLMRILNMSQGAYYMVGAYVGISVARWTGNFALAILAGGIAAGLIGVGMERGFLRQLHRQELGQALLTFGFVYIFMNAAKWIWGGQAKGLPPPSILAGSIDIVGHSFPLYRLFLILAGVVLAIGLLLFQAKTRFGTIIRAGVDNKEMTMAFGINIGLVSAVVFFFGACLTGVAGVIGLPILGAYAESAIDVLLIALIVVIIGGMGTLQGALWGSLVIGLIDSFGRAYFPALAMFTMYLVMVFVLIFKPSGLVGRES